MILEMKRALDDVKNGDRQGYRKLYDAVCEEAYCRSVLILQNEKRAETFMKDFFAELFTVLDEADSCSDLEKWLWQKYYKKMRKQYHKLLEEDGKETRPGGARTLAEIPSTLPLLHRIMLVMSCRDDFTAKEISAIFGLAEDKISTELDKLDRALPALTKNQPDSVSSYLANWRVLLLGASRQIISTSSGEWVDRTFTEAAASAGIAVQEEKKENFDYFVADVDLSEIPSKKKKAAPVVQEEPEDEDDEDEDDEEYDEDDEDEDDEDDGRYDWDLEDDGRKMIIIGIVVALVVVALVAFIGFRVLNRDSGSESETVQTEEEGDADLIIKGDSSDDEEEETEVVEEEETEEVEEEEVEEEEPETVIMEVLGDSVNVRSEASTDGDIVTKVTLGEQVEVLSDTSEEWLQVRCIEQDDVEGYIRADLLSAIE